MIRRLPRALRRGISVRGYVILWAAIMLMMYAGISAAWYAAKMEFGEMKDRIFSDAKALDTDRRLEVKLLGGRISDLVWRLTQDERHAKERDRVLRNAVQTASAMGAAADSEEEKRLVANVTRALDALRLRLASGEAPPLEEVSGMSGVVLDAAHRLAQQNTEQMADTVRAARQLHNLVDRWSLALGLCVAVVLAGGSVGIVNKVVRPTVRLTQAAARFGRGDFEARVKVLRDDELGQLARTFNNMAKGIAEREKSRLEFVAKIAHDIRGPLVTIGGATRWLSRRQPADEEQGTRSKSKRASSR